MKILIITNGTYHSAVSFETKLPAYQIYWGRHYLQIMSCLKKKKKKKYQVDYYIYSLSHGLIEYDREVTRETCDWRGWDKKKLSAYGRSKSFPEIFAKLLQEYDLAFILLSKDFLYSLCLSSKEINKYFCLLHTKLLFFVGNGCDNLLPSYQNMIKIHTGPVEAAKYKINLLELKSYFLKEVCANIF
jgi:hypothetical protein